MRGWASGAPAWPASILDPERRPRLPVEEALREGTRRLAAAGVETARLDAECLLAQILGLNRWRLPLGRDRILSAPEGEAYDALLRRRSRREPLAYLLGRKEFWSLPLAVGPGVLVPRPETETLVEVGLVRLGCRVAANGSRGEAGPGRGRVVVDVGTGSGAILLALASELGSGTFVGTDRSGAALRVAQENVRRLGLGRLVDLARGDLLEPLRGRGLEGQVDLVVANPPYVRTGDWAHLPPEIRQFEPREALDGGPDGLDVIRRIVAAVPRWLRPGGWILLEIGWDQAEAVSGLVRAGEFDDLEIVRDLAGWDRVIAARRPTGGARG